MYLGNKEELAHAFGDLRLSTVKLVPPSLSPHAIHRPLPMLDDLPPRIKVVLFSAPAGFGKTTAMLQWMERLNSNGVITAWLTLDSNDNDIARFLCHAVAALCQCTPPAGQSKLQHAPLENKTASLGSLLDAIDSLSLAREPCVLFLDDYEFISNREIHDIVLQIIGGLPTGSCLVIGTRTKPPLGIGRLRAREQLIEIAADLLCFSLDDAKRYLNEVRGLNLSDQVLADLYHSTEGWASAIQLVSLALIGKQDVEKIVRNFSGRQSAIADYLAEDVLNRQPEPVQDFLLKTSILDSLNPALCNALTGRLDGSALLNQIENANLFLIAFGDDDSSYRYHNLFLLFLRNQLALRYPGQTAELHLKAAQWYAAEGFLTKALEHTFAAGDQATAVTLLDQVAETLLDGGQVATLIRYVNSLPAECVATALRIRIAYTWALIFSHCYPAAKQELASLSHHIGDMSEALKDDFLTLGPCLLLWTDHIDECIALTQENLPKLSKDSHFTSGAMLINFAICLTTEGRVAEALELIDAGEAHLARFSSHSGAAFGAHGGVGAYSKGRLRSSRVALVYSKCTKGLISFSQGRLRSAREQFEAAFRFASQRNRYSSSSAVAAIYLAQAWYEENSLDRAEEMLREYLALIRQTGMPDHVICAHRILSRIAFDQGKLADAQFQLREMEHLGLERGLGRVVSSARLERARIALMEGDLRLAQDVLQQEEADNDWNEAIKGTPHANELDDGTLYRIRLLLKDGNYGDAAKLLRLELRESPAAGSVAAGGGRRGLLAKLLLAAALHCSGEAAAAQRSLAEVIEFVAVAGNKRLILDEAYLLGDLFGSLSLKETPLTPEGALLLAELTGGTSGPDAAPPAAAPLASPGAVDELTRRELQVLKMVADGSSNRDMADKLFLSEVTIKTHMRNITSKLGVHSRTQAVAEARRRKLIAG